MYTLAQRHRNRHKTVVLGVGLVYAVITWTIPLLHNDDCPATHAGDGTGSSVPSKGACPACKFLAASNATEIRCDSGLVLTCSEIIAEFPDDSPVVVASPCAGSIVLRGPPALSLS
jgi:hypothetical protein